MDKRDERLVADVGARVGSRDADLHHAHREQRALDGAADGVAEADLGGKLVDGDLEVGGERLEVGIFGGDGAARRARGEEPFVDGDGELDEVGGDGLLRGVGAVVVADELLNGVNVFIVGVFELALRVLDALVYFNYCLHGVTSLSG